MTVSSDGFHSSTTATNLSRILGNMYMTLKEWTHVINAVKWSPDETLLCAVGPFELVMLYDTTTWDPLFKFEGHLHSVVDCAFSSDRYTNDDVRYSHALTFVSLAVHCWSPPRTIRAYCSGQRLPVKSSRNSRTKFPYP